MLAIHLHLANTAKEQLCCLQVRAAKSFTCTVNLMPQFCIEMLTTFAASLTILARLQSAATLRCWYGSDRHTKLHLWQLNCRRLWEKSLLRKSFVTHGTRKKKILIATRELMSFSFLRFSWKWCRITQKNVFKRLCLIKEGRVFFLSLKNVLSCSVTVYSELTQVNRPGRYFPLLGARLPCRQS